MSIATLGEFAHAIHRDLTAAATHQQLLVLAEGLAIDEIGVQDSYSTTVKSIVLTAAARAFFELVAAAQGEVDGALKGVYLTDDELERLHGGTTRPTRGPVFAFPGTWPYPDPVERDADPVTS